MRTTSDVQQSIIDNSPGGRTPVFHSIVSAGSGPLDSFGSLGSFGMNSNMPDVDMWYRSGEWDGASSQFGYGSLAFPSADMSGDNPRAARALMRNLVLAQRTYAENQARVDPVKAGAAYADLASMQRGYTGLVASGWSERDAASTVGLVGRVFGGYGNLQQDAEYIRRFADGRGVDLASAATELESLRRSFGAQYMSAYGLQPGSQSRMSGMYDEDAKNGFSDFVSAMKAVEDEYSWQFNKSVYKDCAKRFSRMAAELALSGMSVSDVGADQVVKAALRQNGALNTGPDDFTELWKYRESDRGLVSLFPDMADDSVYNPNSQSPDGSGAQDHGLLSAIRRRLFDHRARSVRNGDGPNSFTDTTTLRSDIADALEMFSTSSQGVERRTFEMLADSIVAFAKDGERASVVGLARELADAGLVEGSQAKALGQWSRSLTMATPEAQRRMQEVVAPAILNYANAAGVSSNDPVVTQFTAKLYRLVRRRYLDLTTASGLDGIDAVAATPEIWSQIMSEVAEYTRGFQGLTAQKLQMREEMTKRALKAKEDMQGAE